MKSFKELVQNFCMVFSVIVVLESLRILFKDGWPAARTTFGTILLSIVIALAQTYYFDRAAKKRTKTND